MDELQVVLEQLKQLKSNLRGGNPEGARQEFLSRIPNKSYSVVFEGRRETINFRQDIQRSKLEDLQDNVKEMIRVVDRTLRPRTPPKKPKAPLKPEELIPVGSVGYTRLGNVVP